MPKSKPSRSTIDKLPEVTKNKVLDALIENKPLRYVAEIAGVSHEAIKRYKDRVFYPAIRKAQEIQRLQNVDKPGAVIVAERKQLTKDIAQSSPFQDRLQKLWERVERNLDKVEASPDLQNLAPLLNQAHKNLAILGRATGELETSAAVGIAIQIVLPAPPNSPQSGTKKSASDEVIDIDVSR